MQSLVLRRIPESEIKARQLAADNDSVSFEDEEPIAAAYLKHRRRVKRGGHLLLIGVLLGAAWVRSMFFADGVQWLGREQQLGVTVGEGRVQLVANDEQRPYEMWQYTANERLRADPEFGFSVEHTSRLSLAIPLWSIALAAMLPGLYLRHRRHWSPLFG